MLLRQTFGEEIDYGDEKKSYYVQSSAAAAIFCDGDDGAEETGNSASSLSPPAENGNSLSVSSRRKTGAEGKHRYLTVYIAGCVSCDPGADTGGKAAALIRSGHAGGFDALGKGTAEWFADYWSRSFIRLDGRKKWLAASMVLWIRFLYLFALSKRGEYPPLHQANPLCDATVYRTWSSRFWWFYQSRSEYGMLPIGHPELNAPLMRMTERNIPAYRDFARQAFLSDGICITETSAHDGYQKVPSAIAREMGSLFVYGMPPSAEYIAYGRARDHYISMWNSLSCADPKGSYTMRLVYIAADIADLYRLHYLYSRDEEFLREKAYPMMKGAAEFYRNSPLLHREEDGRYHTFPTNYAETFWGVRDVIDDITMISSLFPTVLYYARRLDTDHDLIPLWQEIADNMAPIPTSDMPDALSPRSKDGKRAFAMCRKPCFVPDSRGAGYPGTACDE